MEDKKNIYQTINAVMGDVGAIGKEKRNQQQGFMYRGVDDVMNALNPAFIKYHLFIVPEVLEQRREERQSAKGGNLIYSVCRVKYTFYAEDGSSIEAVVVGEGMDSGDKASNKALAVAFKYACFQVFCIPTEEMKDPDADSHEVKGKEDGKQKNRGHTPPQLINKDQLNDLMRECDRIGKHWRSICAVYGVEKFSDMTVEQYGDCMGRFKNTPDKAIEEASIPDNIDDDSLPWD